MRLTHPRALSCLFGVALAGIAAGCTNTSLTGPDKSVPKCQVALSGPQATVAPAGGNGSLSVVAAPECQWTAASGATWITELTPASGQGPAQVQFRAGANPANAARQGDITVNGTAARVSQDPAPCTFDVSPRTLTIGAAAGSGSVAVTTPIGCTWNAAAEVPWLSLSSPAQNSGPGAATFNAQANTVATVRIGSLTVAGLAVVVTQQAPGCTYTLAPPTQNIAVGGGSGSVGVTAGAGCVWTATTDVPWISFSGATAGTGPGAVNFNAATNTTSPRTGHVNIAGAVATVTQDGTGSCAFSIDPSSQSIGDPGGSGSTTVTATPGCGWSATSNASWITINSGQAGTGNGSVAYSIAANTGGARNGTLTVAGQTLTVNQSAAGCTFNVAPLTQSAPKTAGAVTAIGVTTASHCAWTASVDPTTPWVSITSGATGNGNGSVGVSVLANTGPLRTGKLTVAGKAVTIDQASGCTFNVAPTSQNVGALGGAATPIGITTAGGCAWTASVNPADTFLHITSPASGAGSGSVQISMDPNLGGARTGRMTVAGQSVTVTQAAVLCSYTIDRAGDTVSSSAGTGAAVVLTTNLPTCTWTATSSDPTWLHVTAGSASGNGNANINWTYDANAGVQRSATLTIGNKVFTVTQSAPACAFTIAPTSGTSPALGGPGSFGITANLQSCMWTATPTDSWVTMTTGTGMGNGTVAFTVAVNATALQRSTTITIPGAQSAFTITQAP